MRNLLLYFTRLRLRYVALKIERDHDRAIKRTRSRWHYAIRNPATPNQKPQK